MLPSSVVPELSRSCHPPKSFQLQNLNRLPFQEIEKFRIIQLFCAEMIEVLLSIQAYLILSLKFRLRELKRFDLPLVHQLFTFLM